MCFRTGIVCIGPCFATKEETEKRKEWLFKSSPQLFFECTAIQSISPRVPEWVPVMHELVNFTTGKHLHSPLVDLGASASHKRTKTMGARFCFQLGPKIPAVQSKQRAQLKPTLHLTMPSPPTTPSAPSVQAFFQKKYVACPSVSCFVHVAAAAAGAVAVVIFQVGWNWISTLPIY